jgi:hypothetical protein
VDKNLSPLAIYYMSVMLEPNIDISLWAQASWTQGMVGKIIQDQSWLLSKAAGLVLGSSQRENLC